MTDAKIESVGDLVERIQRYFNTANKPSGQQESLMLMDDIEGAKLGRFYGVVGERRSRVIILLSPWVNVSKCKLDESSLYPLGIHHVYNGALHTTTENYVFINRKGIGKLAIIIKEVREIDLNSTDYMDRGAVADSIRWAEDCSKIVQKRGQQAKSDLDMMISKGMFPLNPNGINQDSVLYYPRCRYGKNASYLNILSF